LSGAFSANNPQGWTISSAPARGNEFMLEQLHCLFALLDEKMTQQYGGYEESTSP